VTVAVIDLLVERFKRERPWAAVTAYDDRIAHPFVLSRDALNEAASGEGPKLLWRLLAEDPTGRVLQVAATGSAPLDVNTPEDYHRLLAEEVR
jgi:molybdenum cofactor cytidylyltransferase